MVIEIIASYVLKSNEMTMKTYFTLMIFVPLLSATAGNVAGADADRAAGQCLAADRAY